ncbi:T9SS type A sorting domain-containing protein [candidate division KSB1 bacterium]|nr:T9SS type A sorting domain-containing protein [candidate division KSB1 bacterium]NIR70514.1 T9SS type A sorting domain-containing protein [candidate division KSB1 bacterium]NIS24513.1 T9SS type A sorting domain-containing protein [candidate division KSB1 bacterium]NIT70108.1 T9SS type A sorting domain-containing protein [candidate division KSB1 bacterium]NIU23763.1 T9SS type A sorting domain-containing protein [candidate division KSB1 bacterium]
MKSIKVIFMLFIFTVHSWAQTNENITLVGRWPDGPCNTAIAVENIAYTGNGGAIDVLDVFEPDRPAKIGRVVTPGVVNDIFVTGNYLYIANGKAGLRIVDIRVPASPHEIAHLATSGEALRVFVQGDHAYMAADTAGLRIIDITDPFAPEEVATVKSNGYTQDVFVSGNFAYVANSEEGLKIIDVTDPASPVEISSFDFDGLFRITSVTVQGKYGYVLVTGKQPLSRGALSIVDISKPDSLYEVGRDIITGDWASSGRKVVLKDSLAYVALFSDAGNGLQIFDVSNPANPMTVGHHFTLAALDIFVDDEKLAFIADGRNGLSILDVNSPSSVEVIGNYDTPDASRDVFVSDHLAFVASDGLRVLDLTDPSNPSQLDHFEISPHSWAGRVFVSNQLAFLTTNASLRIIDITRPDSLFQIASFSVLARAVQVVGDYAFVLDRDQALHIIDVNDPAHPKRISKYQIELPKLAFGGNLFVSNGYAYVAAASAGLHIFDITDVNNPIQVSHIEANGSSLDVFVLQDCAYLAETGGLRIIEVSNPKAARVLGQTHRSIAALGVFVANVFAYVATVSGLTMIDVSERDLPVEVGFFKTGDVARSAYVANDLIHVADNDDGLYILRNDLTTKIEHPTTRSQNFILHYNYPNPFNPETTIRYGLPEPRRVRLIIYNVFGQNIKTLVDEVKAAGSYSVTWDGTDERGQPVPSGVYFYRFDAGVVSGTKKMILMR